MSRRDWGSGRGRGRFGAASLPATLAAFATLGTLAILAGCQDAPDRDAEPGPATAPADNPVATPAIPSADTPGQPGWTVLGRLPGQAEALTLAVGPRAVHALWIAETDRGPSLLHATFPAGAVDTLVGGWAALRSPRLAPADRGLLAFFVGGATASDELSLHVVEVGDGGPPRRLAAVPDRTGPPAVAVDADGAPVTAWPTSAGTRLAHGIAPDGPPGEVPFCCDADLALARDRDGSIVLAGAVEGGGLRTLTVIPADDGAFDVPDSRAAATAAGGARYVLAGSPGVESVHVVYCGGAGSCDGVRAWRHGALPNEPATFLASVRSAVTALTATATADGRLWAVWTGADSLHAARTAPEGTRRAGGRVAAALPTPGTTPLALAAAAPDGALRVVVAGAEAGAGAGAVVLRERRLLPGLTVMPPAMAPPLDVDARLRLVVEDAGEPVAGAVVRALGAEATTDARGAVELLLPAGVRTDTLAVHVEAPGYAPLHVLFHAERP